MKQCRMAVTTEPSARVVTPDHYVPAPKLGHHPPDYEVIGGYPFQIKVRQCVNAPGVLRNDFVGQLANRWDGPSTIWWGRNQGSSYPLVGGAVYQPLPAYSAQVMAATPPPANRAAFSAAVQKFLATRGNRANGS